MERRRPRMRFNTALFFKMLGGTDYKEFAKMAGVSQAASWTWCNGIHRPTSLKNIKKISSAFGCSLKDFLTYE